MVLTVVLGLAVVILPTPAPASATEIGHFSTLGDFGTIDYMDFTMINASASPMIVLDHGADYPDRQLRGAELYNNTALGPGDYAEYAASGRSGGLNYLWSLAGTRYQVKFRSERVAGGYEESVICTWYENGDYSHEITDAPYTCAVDVNQGQYGHTTEWMTVADKDITTLDNDDQATVLTVVDKLCRDSGNAKVYPANCQIGYDLTGSRPKPTLGLGLPTVVAQGENCLTDRDVPLSSTKTVTVANTVGWSETTSASASFKWIWPEAYELTLTLSQSFTYNSSTTDSSTDSQTYSAPMAPRSAAQLTVSYPVLRLTTGVKAVIAHTTIVVEDLTVTLRKPGSSGTEVAKSIPFNEDDC